MDNISSPGAPKKACCTSSNLNWWATLVVAVLAVPSFGIIVSSMIPIKGIGEVVVFILACWLCTYLGMHLMRRPSMSQKLDLTQRDKQ
jgi:uncharacterized oligopeptide transporter (OPT) family protein